MVLINISAIIIRIIIRLLLQELWYLEDSAEDIDILRQPALPSPEREEAVRYGVISEFEW